MSDDLAAAIARRNRVLRAWRDYGVPVEGRWEIREGAREMRLLLRCLACSTVGTKVSWATDVMVDLPTLERHEVQHKMRADYCDHLLPLLAPPPPEVEAIAALLVLEVLG